MTENQTEKAEVLSAYFNLSYRGFPMEDLTVTELESGLGVDLYRCRMCAALTDMPTIHADWHEGRFPPAGGESDG